MTVLPTLYELISTLNNKPIFCDTTSVIKKNTYTAIDLFAGAGGLALGLEKAGFTIKAVLEIDRYACQTLKSNRSYWNIIRSDIIEVAQSGISKYLDLKSNLDLLSGGYPCQAFSYAGKRMGLEDARGTMFYYYAAILEQLKPKIFLVENVKGLSTHDSSRTLDIMLDIFSDIGYRLQWKILNSNDYNVAQSRERLFIIGIRNDISPLISFAYPKPFSYKPVLNDILKDVPKSDGITYPPYKKYLLSLIPEGGNWRNLSDTIIEEYLGEKYLYPNVSSYSGLLHKLSRNKPCPTLLCSPTSHLIERCHPFENRPFSVREYARIQSFPDDWDFAGSVYQQYKQIGNAVPVELAKAMGLSIINTLNEIHE